MWNLYTTVVPATSPHRSTGRIGAPSPPSPVPSTRLVCPAKASHFLTWYARIISLNVLKCHVHLCLISHEAFYYLQRDDCARDSFPHHDNSESDNVSIAKCKIVLSF